jgi:hypothetical protein
MTKKLILNSGTWRNLDKNNPYFKFIEECKTKKHPEGTTLNLHHIIPKYVFGTNPSTEDAKYMDSVDNVIVLSVQDHKQAHELLYQIYGNPQDQGAALLLNGYEAESREIWRKLGAQATNKLMQERRQTFWDPEFQKEMAQRSISKPGAIEARRASGKKGGIATKTNVAIKPEHKYEFSFEKKPVLCIINCSLGSQVVEELKKFKETPLQRATPLLNGSRKNLNGWSCIRLNNDGSIPDLNPNE